MKKIILFAYIATVMTSCCKEDEVKPVSPVNSASYEEQVADLIQKTDENLYNKVYNSNGNDERVITTSVTVRFIPGTFVVLDGDVASGTCFPTNSICMVLVSASVNADVQVGPVGTGVHFTYSRTQEAKIIVNSSPSPILSSVSEVSTSAGANGSVNIFYRQ